MNAVLLLIKLALFCLSCFGWCLWANEKHGIKGELTPVVTVSAQTCACFFAALLNIFTPVEWGIYLGGFFALFYCIKKDYKTIRVVLPARYWIFAAALVWLLFLTRGGIIWGHDNMAHWAIMAKKLVVENRLPNTSDNAISFTGYPPGAALFIKYFCNFVGFSDGMMFFAQGTMILCGIFALSVFVPVANAAAGLVLFLYAVFLLSCSVPLNDLRVDTLLASQGLAGLCAVVYYARTDLKKVLKTVLPVYCCLAVIKNSGLYFILLGTVLLTFFCIKNKFSLKHTLGEAAACLGVPALCYWLWLRHTALIFPKADASKHAVSIAGYAGIFGDKTPEQIHEFNQLFVRHFVVLSGDKAADTRILWVLAFSCMAMIAVSFFQKQGKKVLFAVLGMTAAELGYIGCLWGTYAFSMNADEMLCLASIQRYHITTLSVLFGALLILAFQVFLTDQKKSPAGVLVFCIFLIGAFVLGKPDSAPLYSRKPYHNSETQGEWLELKNKYALTDGSRYLVYTRGGDTDTWSERFIARYVLCSDKVDFWQYEDQEFTWNDLYSQYDYFVLLAPDKRSDAFLGLQGYASDCKCVHLILP